MDQAGPSTSTTSPTKKPIFAEESLLFDKYIQFKVSNFKSETLILKAKEAIESLESEGPKRKTKEDYDKLLSRTKIVESRLKSAKCKFANME